MRLVRLFSTAPKHDCCCHAIGSLGVGAEPAALGATGLVAKPAELGGSTKRSWH